MSKMKELYIDELERCPIDNLFIDDYDYEYELWQDKTQADMDWEEYMKLTEQSFDEWCTAMSNDIDMIQNQLI